MRDRDRPATWGRERRPRKPAERRRVAWLVHGPILPAGVTRSGLGGLRAHALGGIPGSSASQSRSRREARGSCALGFNIAARGAPIRLPLTADGRSLRALRASLAHSVRREILACAT